MTHSIRSAGVPARCAGDVIDSIGTRVTGTPVTGMPVTGTPHEHRACVSVVVRYRDGVVAIRSRDHVRGPDNPGSRESTESSGAA